MEETRLSKLNIFLGKAMLATYAGNGERSAPQRPGHNELEFIEGDWSYRDSYSGYFRSWGQEIVWYKGSPFWTQLYGGGMEEKYHGDDNFARETFNFLKTALSSGNKSGTFQPRGPKYFSMEEWDYFCDWQGDIRDFKGHENISYKNEVVFTHKYFGGIYLAKK